MKIWTKKDISWLIKNYPDKGKIYCCEKLGRSEPSIRAKVYELKLKSNFKHNKEANYNRGAHFRGKKRPKHSKWMKENFDSSCTRTEDAKKKNSDAQKRLIKEGKLRTDKFKGHKHTKEAKKRMSVASKKMWANPSHYLNSEAHRQLLSDLASRRQQENPTLNRYSRGKGQHIIIEDKKYWFRSSWEVIYAKYLQFLKKHKEIMKWEYEVDTFWFVKIKRGVRSYKPDFKVFCKDGSVEYHEVKGWMDPKSITKLKRMKKYYPDVKMRIVDKDVMKEIKKIRSVL